MTSSESGIVHTDGRTLASFSQDTGRVSLLNRKYSPTSPYVGVCMYLRSSVQSPLLKMRAFKGIPQ